MQLKSVQPMEVKVFPAYWKHDTGSMTGAFLVPTFFVTLGCFLFKLSIQEHKEKRAKIDDMEKMKENQEKQKKLEEE